MDRETMNKYFEIYSTDYEDAVSTYYTDDIVFEYAGNKYSGKEAVLNYFKSIRDNFNETLVPAYILIEADRVAAEVNAELRAVRDLPDFWGRSFRKGDSLTMTFGIFYHTRQNQIDSVRIYRP